MLLADANDGLIKKRKATGQGKKEEKKEQQEEEIVQEQEVDTTQKT